MAKKQLTIEEKLEAALVPVEEQPYKVPENWCFARGSHIMRKMESQKPTGENFSYIDIDSIDNSRQIVREPKNIPVSKAPSRASRKVNAGDTLFSLVRPYLMNIAYVTDDLSSCIASTGFYVCSPKKNVNDKYLYWMMVSPYVVDGLNSKMKGDNSPSIRGGDIENFIFPVAPLAEQSRIVARIESLFVKLDEAKEKIQEVLDGADLRRANILHQAFTGKLTEKWRREKGVSYESWEETMFDDCIDKMQNGLSKRKGSAGESYAVLRLANIGVVDVNTDDLRYIMLDDKEISKYELNHGDVLMIRVNGSRDNVGKQIYVKNPIKWAFCDHLIRIKYKDGVSAQFMCLLSETHSYRRYIEDNMVSSAGQNTISRKGMQDYKVNLPSMSEQKEIVRLLDNLLSREQSTVTACEEALTTIDTLKKSILARAFRGELGTNDPSEASAKELLQEILAS